MPEKNIQMKIKNNDIWDILFPKTKANITFLNDGKTVEETISSILTILGTKLDLAAVQSEIEKVIGSAPVALDTLQELANALNNDANFAATVTDLLSKKVDKVVGKQLSTEDFTTDLKTKLISLNNYIHPVGDGNLHVPATGINNNGNFLKSGSIAGSLTWSQITIADILSLQTALDGKAPISHTHSVIDIDDFPALSTSAISGEYVDLNNTPTKLSQFINDINFDGRYYIKSEIDKFMDNTVKVVMSPIEDTTVDFWLQEISLQIYINGIENIGTWETNLNSGYVTFNKYATYMDLRAYNGNSDGQIINKTAIDVTNYSKLNIDWETISYNSAQANVFITKTTDPLTAFTNNVAYVSSNVTKSRAIQTIDISQITGNIYVGLYNHTVYGNEDITSKIYNIWFE